MDARGKNRREQGKPPDMQNRTTRNSRRPLRDIKNVVAGSGVNRANRGAQKDKNVIQHPRPRNNAQAPKPDQEASSSKIVRKNRLKHDTPIKSVIIQSDHESEESFSTAPSSANSVEGLDEFSSIGSSVDIDKDDRHDPLAVVDYVNDIYGYYREYEKACPLDPYYMCNQDGINENMRRALIDWLIDAHLNWALRQETLFLAVNTIDRYLERQKVVKDQLQLVGLTAMLMASKYEEVSAGTAVETIIGATENSYDREEILDMEKRMANTLQFNMAVPTAYTFMKRFLKAAASDMKTEFLTGYLMELCLLEYEMLRYPPSQMAAAAIYAAQCSTYGFRMWSRASEVCSRYSENQLLECSRKMVGFHHQVTTGRRTNVEKKYNSSRFGFAARAEPARFLLHPLHPRAP